MGGMGDTADRADRFTGHWVPLGCARLFLAVLGCTRLYWAELDCSGLPGCVELYRAAVCCTGRQWALPGYIGLKWTLLG